MRTLRCFGFVAALITAAHPATAAGINLAWDECGIYGSVGRVSSCNTNAGTNTMVVSYVPPAGITALVGSVAIIDLTSASPTLPDWWQVMNYGSCRDGALSVSADFSSPAYANCQDYWSGYGSASAQYVVGYGGDPGAARIVVSGSIPVQFAVPLDPASEYYDFLVHITNQSTVGAGSCAGCDVGVCVVLNEVQLDPSGRAETQVLTNPQDNYMLTWQGGVVGCPLVVPVKNRTWGSIKALYR